MRRALLLPDGEATPRRAALTADVRYTRETSTMEASANSADCITCYGKGEIVDDFGPSRCPDCGGAGKQLDGHTKTEWRLRDIEGGHVGTAHGCEADVRWLAFELRRAREALLRIVARSQEGDDDDEIARDVRHEAIEALALYSKVRDADAS